MPNSRPLSKLHYRLRSAIRSAHHVLDHHRLLAPLSRRDLTVDQYANVIAALHGIYTKAESWILVHQEQLDPPFNYSLRLKVPALELDLAALGRAPFPCRSEFPPRQTRGDLIGVLYAIEGSTQGGQVIARLVRQSANTNLPIRFFTGYGEMSHQWWEDFLRFADTWCPEREYGFAENAAVSFFEAIRHHLDDCQSACAFIANPVPAKNLKPAA